MAIKFLAFLRNEATSSLISVLPHFFNGVWSGSVLMMAVVDCMRSFLRYKEMLDEVERQETYMSPAGEESYEEEFKVR